MAKKQDDFLNLLNSRLLLAKTNSKKWRKKVDKWMKDYEIDTLEDIDFKNLHNKLQIPYIFSTVESALPSMFERVPNIMLLQRGKLDRDFTEWANKVWDYVKERVHLEDKIDEAGLSFLIAGMGFAKWGWDLETEKVKEEVQQEIKNEDGQVIGTQPVVEEYEVETKSDPFIRIYGYREIYFSPESKFILDDEENIIPYVICKNVMTPEEAKDKYGTSISEDDITKINWAELDDELVKKKIHRFEKERVKIYEYYGVLPQKYAGKDGNWKYNNVYYLVFTGSKVLIKPTRIHKKPLLLLGNYGKPTSFFKFGEPRVLRELEQDVSLGRSRIADIRDKQGTKIAIPQGIDVDERSLKNPADFTIMRSVGNTMPAYINPPPIPESILIALGQSREDIQMASAQLDISRGGGSSVVQTATGQNIFEKATQRRIQRKKKKIARFIKALAKNLLMLCAENWDLEKFVKITDMSPIEIQQNKYIAKLKELGNDYNVSIEEESVTSNKETQSAQAIALYRETKDDPLVNREEVLKEALKIGFGITDFDRFLSKNISPDQVLQTLEYLVKNGLIDQQAAGMIAQALGSLTQQPGGGNVGRPATANPTDIVQKSMPGANNTQVTAQNMAAGQQTGVAKGPQNIK